MLSATLVMVSFIIWVPFFLSFISCMHHASATTISSVLFLFLYKIFLCCCHQREEGIDVRKMMGHKRSPCSVDQSSYTSIAPKKQKADLSISSKVSFCFSFSFISFGCWIIVLFFFSFSVSTQMYLQYPKLLKFFNWEIFNGASSLWKLVRIIVYNLWMNFHISYWWSLSCIV